MSDQCARCTNHGDPVACDAEPCGVRENWRYVALAEECAERDRTIADLRAEMERMDKGWHDANVQALEKDMKLTEERDAALALVEEIMDYVSDGGRMALEQGMGQTTAT